MGDGRARIYREKLGKRTVGRWGRFFGGVGRSLTRARLEGIFETDFDFFYNCFLGVMSWHLTTKYTTPRQGYEFGILRIEFCLGSNTGRYQIYWSVPTNTGFLLNFIFSPLSTGRCRSLQTIFYFFSLINVYTYIIRSTISSFMWETKTDTDKFKTVLSISLVPVYTVAVEKSVL